MQELRIDELKQVDGGFAISIGTIITIGFGIPFVAGFVPRSDQGTELFPLPPETIHTDRSNLRGTRYAVIAQNPFHIHNHEPFFLSLPAAFVSCSLQLIFYHLICPKITTCNDSHLQVCFFTHNSAGVWILGSMYVILASTTIAEGLCHGEGQNENAPSDAHLYRGDR